MQGRWCQLFHFSWVKFYWTFMLCQGLEKPQGRGHGSHRSALGKRELPLQGEMGAGVGKCCGATKGGGTDTEQMGDTGWGFQTSCVWAVAKAHYVNVSTKKEGLSYGRALQVESQDLMMAVLDVPEPGQSPRKQSGTLLLPLQGWGDLGLTLSSSTWLCYLLPVTSFLSRAHSPLEVGYMAVVIPSLPLDGLHRIPGEDI